MATYFEIESTDCALTALLLYGPCQENAFLSADSRASTIHGPFIPSLELL